MTSACSQLYLARTSRAVGNMLHDAVYVYGMDGSDFLERFIQSGIASEIEEGNPKYIAGRSGFELFLDVMGITRGASMEEKDAVNYERSDAYWVGWMLVHYQWYSSFSYRSILDEVSYESLTVMYITLHEADITKSYCIMDSIMNRKECALKAIRIKSGMTQEELAEKSGVSVNTIRAYERKSKDLKKSGMNIVMNLSEALACNVADLVS